MKGDDGDVDDDGDDDDDDADGDDDDDGDGDDGDDDDDDDDSSMDGMGYPISRMFRNWRNYLSQFTWNMKQIMFWLNSPQGWP